MRMKESTHSESNNKLVKLIGYIPPPKPINYKPNIVKGQSEVKSQQYTKDKEENKKNSRKELQGKLKLFTR